MARHFSILLGALILAVALAPVFSPETRAAGQPLVVVVAAALPLKDISTAVLRRSFMGEAAEYAAGKRLIPINHPPGTPARMQFDRTILGLQPDEVGRFWIDRRIRDQPPPPKTVPSVELAVRIVMSLPGAISYATADMVNANVRVLSIDGKSPGQAGYALQ